METTQVDGIYYSDEKAAAIAASFSYDSFQIVRREMFAHLGVPAVTIRKDSITFNTACINGFEDVVYIQILVSANQKRIAIRKCDENDKDALRWCIAKPDKRKTRKIVGKKFSAMIYQMMGWDDTCRYKITGHRIEYQGEPLYVFELQEPEIFRERPKRTKEEQEELAKDMTPEELEALRKREIAESRKAFLDHAASVSAPDTFDSAVSFFPADAANTFGVPVEEHENRPNFGNPNAYVGMNAFAEGGPDDRQ